MAPETASFAILTSKLREDQALDFLSCFANDLINDLINDSINDTINSNREGDGCVGNGNKRKRIN